MNNTPDFLLQAMANRKAKGLFARVHPEDEAKFTKSGGGVLSMYPATDEQMAAYVAAVEARGCRVLYA